MKNIFKTAALFSMGLFSGTIGAQVLTNSPTVDQFNNNNAFFDGSTNFDPTFSFDNNNGKGLVFPRTDLTQWVWLLDDMNNGGGTILQTGYDGMIVYNTGTGNTPTGGINPTTSTAVSPGFYYFSNPTVDPNNFAPSITDGQWIRIGGAGGASITNGTTNPVDGTGNEGDFYINTTTNQIFGPYNNGTWPAGTSLVGPEGPAGAPGAPGAPGTNGTNGADGADGLLPPGTAAGNTTYWNGTEWVVNSNNIFNNGGNIGIGTNTPASSAILELSGSDKALLITRVDDIDDIEFPVNGMIVYDNTLGCFRSFQSNSWSECNFVQNASVLTLECNSASASGSLTVGVTANNVVAQVPYTGGNGGAYSSENIASTGVTGLTATISGGNLNQGSGTLFYTISGTPSSSGTAEFFISLGSQACTFEVPVSAGGPIVSGLDCAAAAVTGTLTANTAASGVFVTIAYTGGNGSAYNSQLISSSGVTGLVASLNAGTLTNGVGGNIFLNISGTPVSNGVANFDFNFGGVACSFSVNVAEQPAVAAINSCSTTFAGSLIAGQAATGVTQTVEYTGGNGAAYGALSFPSSGVSGLTANLTAGTLSNGTGTLLLNITGTPSVDGTATFNITLFGANCSFTRTVAPPPATVSGLTCASATFSPTNLFQAVSYTGTITLPYTGGNGQAYGAGTGISSTGVTGLTATLQAGTLANGSGNLTFNVTGTPNNTGTASFNINFGGQNCTVTVSVDPTPPLVSGLTCGSATFNPANIFVGESYSGTATIPYTGGNGVSYAAGSAINSTGVTNLTATLQAGTLNNGAGTLTYAISGTPATTGTASFAVNFGGQVCTLNVSVTPAGVPNICNPSNPTAIVDVTNAHTGKTWMDRNLGANRAATSSTDAVSYGSLYQWGRGSDGHQCVNRYAGDGVTTSSTTATLSSSDMPGHGDFITTNSSPNNWRSPQNNNLWQGVSGTNNPCPSGYRIPTEAELNNERLSWVQAPISSTNNAAGAFASPLKLPMAGSRGTSSGSFSSIGSLGAYWSSTVSSTSARRLNFFNTGASMTGSFRAFGFSVRCIKD